MEAEFFSFGTNDLTQMTLGYSRDDIASFVPRYLDRRASSWTIRSRASTSRASASSCAWHASAAARRARSCTSASAASTPPPGYPPPPRPRRRGGPPRPPPPRRPLPPSARRAPPSRAPPSGGLAAAPPPPPHPRPRPRPPRPAGPSSPPAPRPPTDAAAGGSARTARACPPAAPRRPSAAGRRGAHLREPLTPPTSASRRPPLDPLSPPPPLSSPSRGSPVPPPPIGDGGVVRSCADVRTDTRNCGACGNSCMDGYACDNGVCRIRCDELRTACPRADADAGATGGGEFCTNTSTDIENCGACGTRCPFGQLCSGGTCATMCGAGSPTARACAPTPRRDREHCGACGTACAAGQVCTEGMCVTNCGAGLTDCMGACRDLSNDNANCGACGRRVPRRSGVLRRDVPGLLRGEAPPTATAPAATSRPTPRTAGCAGGRAPRGRSALAGCVR